MSISDSGKLRLRRPVRRDGKREDITILKSTVGETSEDRTIKRTIDGEKAALQIKWVVGSDGTIEIVHIHCMKDKPSSEWSKRSSLPVERFYEVSHKDDIWLIKCKICGRKWDSSGSPNPVAQL